MANDTIFKVKDKKLGTVTLVQASSKKRAEKFTTNGRFEVSKATAEEIRRVVDEGGKIFVEGPHVQSGVDVDPAQTATRIHEGKALPNPAEAQAPLTEKAPEKNIESHPAGHELGHQPVVEGGLPQAEKATLIVKEQAAGVIASDMPKDEAE